MYYESVGGLPLADRVESEIWNQVEESNRFPFGIPESEYYPGARKLAIQKFPYVAFLRELETDLWEVVDVVHTSRKLPKGSATEGDDG